MQIADSRLQIENELERQRTVALGGL